MYAHCRKTTQYRNKTEIHVALVTKKNNTARVQIVTFTILLFVKFIPDAFRLINIALQQVSTNETPPFQISDLSPWMGGFICY